MNGTPWVLVAIIPALIVAVLGVVVLKRYGKGKFEPDYYNYYTVGLIWTLFGLVFYSTGDNIPFLALGIVFLLIGLVNKSKWKKHPSITPLKRQMLIGVFALSVLLVLVTAIIVFRVRI